MIERGSGENEAIYIIRVEKEHGRQTIPLLRLQLGTDGKPKRTEQFAPVWRQPMLAFGYRSQKMEDMVEVGAKLVSHLVLRSLWK